ncbi:6-phosphogluconolactonase [Azospirillum sp. TSO22-1]|uniref:6-phosphogluconolactonase n=1 Tax=Azospirillum sp. TSO22-1 TaxID=716789 RepID=UPI000D61B574|nr:6-phosphogluconolactonase [Azospirillum sp. TSO22-1]PWC45768.1 6-phosphogluconolactonase [Azospirillum sp. TSO22-1]
MGTTTVTVLPDAEALADAAAQWLTERAVEHPDKRFAVTLAGGSTPRRLYERLAEPPLRDRFPWARVHWFWGDERFVPPDDAKSNLRMARESLLTKAPVPAGNVHPVPTVGVSPQEAARAYQRNLVAFYGAPRLDPARPLFDVTLLGLGPDGHTASLFPGTPALDERNDWVAAVLGAQPEPRITLTFPALGSSRHVAFLIAGEGKRAVFARFHRGDTTLPAARLHPAGDLTIFVDAAAAAAPLTGP